MAGRAAASPGTAERRGAVLNRLLLDTTFLIDAERDDADLDTLIDDDDDVAVAAITVAELLLGVELADDQHRAGRHAFVDAVVTTVPVVAYDLAVARVHATLLADVRRAGRPRGAHDLIIASTGIAASRIIVTADPSGFIDLPGLQIRAH